MRIAVDGGSWMNDRGYGRFTRELLLAAASLPSAHRFTLVVDSSVPEEAVATLPTIRVPLERRPDRAASADGYRSPSDLWSMSRALASQAVDCVFFPSSCTYVPLATRRKIVVCIHDVIYKRYPALIFANARARLFWHLKTRAALWQATRIVTVSEHARSGIAEHLHVAREAIRVVPEAPASAFRPDADTGAARRTLATFGLSSDVAFVVYVGGVSPHKNLGALVDAVAALRRTDRFADLHLLIVGEYADQVFFSGYAQIRQQIDHGSIRGVIFTGRLDDDVVAGLMRLAKALVLPSFDEGFGLPAIEAAACGAAVLVTQHSAMPEMLGTAAVYFDPHESGALRRELERILSNEPMRTGLGARAAARAAEHTWTAAGRALLAVFDELDDRHPPAGGA